MYEICTSIPVVCDIWFAQPWKLSDRVNDLTAPAKILSKWVWQRNHPSSASQSCHLLITCHFYPIMTLDSPQCVIVGTRQNQLAMLSVVIENILQKFLRQLFLPYPPLALVGVIGASKTRVQHLDFLSILELFAHRSLCKMWIRRLHYGYQRKQLRMDVIIFNDLYNWDHMTAVITGLGISIWYTRVPICQRYIMYLNSGS